jgi:hypothetical protein
MYRFKKIVNSFNQNVNYNVEVYGFEKILRQAAWYPKPLGIKINVQHSGAWSNTINTHLKSEIKKNGHLPLLTFQKEILKHWKLETNKAGLIIPHPFIYNHKAIKKNDVKNALKIGVFFGHTYYCMEKSEFHKGNRRLDYWLNYKRDVIERHKNSINFLINEFSTNNELFISLSEHDFDNEIVKMYEDKGLRVMEKISASDYDYIAKFKHKLENLDLALFDSPSLSATYFCLVSGVRLKLVRCEDKFSEVSHEELDIENFFNSEKYKYLDNYQEFYNLSRWSLSIRIRLCVFLYVSLAKWVFSTFFGQRK